MHNLTDLFLDSKSAGDWEAHLTSYLKIHAWPALILFLMSLLLVSVRETVPAPVWWEPVLLSTSMFIYVPRAPAYHHFPVVPPAVDEHVASYAIAPLARESLWGVTLFG